MHYKPSDRYWSYLLFFVEYTVHILATLETSSIYEWIDKLEAELMLVKVWRECDSGATLGKGY